VARSGDRGGAARGHRLSRRHCRPHARRSVVPGLAAARGEFVESALADHLTATIHPSAILRRPTDAERRAEMRRFVADLEKVARVLGGTSR
jgi:hypothetical protein